MRDAFDTFLQRVFLSGELESLAAELAAPPRGLAYGRALLAGGSDTHDTPLASVELLGPQGATLGAPRVQARGGLRLTLLRDGRVLATGGAGAAGPLASAEVWSPTTQAWSAVAPMAGHRDNVHYLAL